MSRTVKEWVKSRKALINKEKEFTILRDHLSQQRRDLRLIVVINSISLMDRTGESLSDLFDGRCQLMVYNFMSIYV